MGRLDIDVVSHDLEQGSRKRTPAPSMPPCENCARLGYGVNIVEPATLQEATDRRNQVRVRLTWVRERLTAVTCDRDTVRGWRQTPRTQARLARLDRAIVALKEEVKLTRARRVLLERRIAILESKEIPPCKP